MFEAAYRAARLWETDNRNGFCRGGVLHTSYEAALRGTYNVISDDSVLRSDIAFRAKDVAEFTRRYRLAAPPVTGNMTWRRMKRQAALEVK
jgi:hypothetical protein